MSRYAFWIPAVLMAAAAQAAVGGFGAGGPGRGPGLSGYGSGGPAGVL